MSPAELFRAVGSGDESAFAELYSRFCDVVVAKLRRLCQGNESDVEDCSQEAWLHIWRQSIRYAKKEPVNEAYVIGIILKAPGQVANKLFRRRMQKKRGGVTPGIHEPEVRASIYGERWYTYDGSARVQREVLTEDVSPVADSARRVGLVQQLVFELPPQQLSLLDQYYEKSMPVRQIAAETGKSEAAVHRGLCYGVQTLRYLVQKKESTLIAA